MGHAAGLFPLAACRCYRLVESLPVRLFPVGVGHQVFELLANRLALFQVLAARFGLGRLFGFYGSVRPRAGGVELLP